MKTVHLVIPDLFLPQEIAAEACAGLHLPALEKLLARSIAAGPARPEAEGTSLESLLCSAFGMPCAGELPVAPVAAAFDGLGDGCWLCAAPAHLALQGNRLVLYPEPELGADEAVRFCAGLNEHFAGQGLQFFAPHPRRWYVRLAGPVDIETVPLSLAAGRSIGDLLPGGGDATRWRQVFNEVQMLLFAHPLNAEREARGMPAVNSVWLWGGGCVPAVPPPPPYDSVMSDDVLAAMFAAAAGIPYAEWSDTFVPCGDRQLLVFTGLRAALRRGDLAGWRDALQAFETGYARPLLRALRAGKFARLQMDVPGDEGNRSRVLTRADAWAFWRRGRGLAV